MVQPFTLLIILDYFMNFFLDSIIYFIFCPMLVCSFLLLNFFIVLTCYLKRLSRQNQPASSSAMTDGNRTLTKGKKKIASFVDRVSSVIVFVRANRSMDMSYYDGELNSQKSHGFYWFPFSSGRRKHSITDLTLLTTSKAKMFVDFCQKPILRFFFLWLTFDSFVFHRTETTWKKPRLKPSGFRRRNSSNRLPTLFQSVCTHWEFGAMM